MTLLNIIDNRKQNYRFKKINAIIEPTRHDNVCKNADKSEGKDTWIGYDEKEHISINEAILWAESHEDEVTLYIYDEGAGIYGARVIPSKEV